MNHINTRWRKVNLSRPTPEAWPNITELTSGPALEKVPPGYTAWAVGRWNDDPARRGTFSNDPDDPGTNAHIVVMPTLIPDAPLSIRIRYLARAVAIATARCPLCGGRAHLDRMPPPPGEQGQAVFHALPLYVRVQHAPGCPVDDWTDAERQWFVPFRDNHHERSHR